MKTRMDVVRLLAVLVVVSGNELVGAGEAIEDEVVTGLIDATVHQRGRDQAQPEDKSGSRTHGVIVVDPAPCFQPECATGPDVMTPRPVLVAGGGFEPPTSRL